MRISDGSSDVCSSDLTVPLASVVVRRAYGIAGSAMSNAERFQYRFAWPSGDWGSLPIEGGVEVAYKSELEAAEDPAAHLEAIRERLNRVRSPFRPAEKFGVGDIIDPRDTRPLLCAFSVLAWRVLNGRSLNRTRHCERSDAKHTASPHLYLPAPSHPTT